MRGAGDDCDGETAPSSSSAQVSDASTLTLRRDTASHSLALALVPLVSARAATFPRGPAAAAATACSARSRARRSSHRALSASARSRPSAFCRRHSVTCAAYEVFQASCSAAEMEEEDDDVCRSGCCCSALAGVGDDSAGWVCGDEGETRVRLGGTEKGSESAACHGVSGSVGGELDPAEQGGGGNRFCGLTWRRSSASGRKGLVRWPDIS